MIIMNSKPVQFKHQIDLIPDGLARCIAYNPTGELLAIGTENGFIFIYQVSDWEILEQLENDYSINSIVWSPDSKFLAIGSMDGPIKIWRTSNWSMLNSLEESKEALNLSWSSDGKFLAVGSWGCSDDEPFLDIWNAVDWQKIPNKIPRSRYISFNPDSSLLAVVCALRGLEIYSLPNFERIYFLDFSDSKKHVSIFDPSWSSDGSLIAASCGDGRIRIWQTSDWSEIITKQVHNYWDDGEYGVSFSPDGRFLLSGGVGEPKILTIDKWHIIDPFDKGTLADIFSKSWNPNNKQVALILRNGLPIEIWNIV